MKYLKIINKQLVLLLVSFLLIQDVTHAQQDDGRMSCKLLLDSSWTVVTPMAAVRWAENPPLTLVCDQGARMKLHSFEFSIFTRKPLQSREFGSGDERGIPLLGLNALKNAKPGDTMILKNIIVVNEAGIQFKLPVQSFKLE